MVQVTDDSATPVIDNQDADPSLADSAMEGSTDRPWTPGLIMAVIYFFGPLACEVAAGINFARMGKRAYLLPCFFIGAAVMCAELFLLISLVGIEEKLRLVIVFVNFWIGLGFMLTHQPRFEEWKETTWVPTEPDERYKPTRVGLLLLVSSICLAVQLGVGFVVVTLAG